MATITYNTEVTVKNIEWDSSDTEKSKWRGVSLFGYFIGYEGRFSMIVSYRTFKQFF